MTLKRKITNRLTSSWMTISLIIITLLPLVIGFTLYLKAAPILQKFDLLSLLFSSDWLPAEEKFGFWAFISSSLHVTLLAFLFAAPVCLLAGIYITQFAPPRLIKVIHPVIDILAGLPSVIYGVWGILVIVPFISKILAPALGLESTGYTILAGSIVLSIMCIPYMLNMIIEVFNTIPLGLKEASFALGSTKWEMVKHVVIRKGFPGIISSFGLGIAKAFGETLAVMMVVGNNLVSGYTPLKPGYPLTALIANNYGEMLSIPMYDSALMFAALLLLIIILIINLIFRYFIHKTNVA